MYIPLTFEGALQKCLFASGGYEGYFISGSQEYKYHLFTSSVNLEVQKGSIDNVQIYVIGGGGGGARGTTNVTPAGGGGGGGTNFIMNGRLFQGTYNIVVGRGGGRQLTQNNNGTNGLPSSVIGANLNLVANGGSGGTWGSGGGGGASGNGFSGGSSQTANGGGGGGSTVGGDTATSLKAGNGGAGNIFYFAGYPAGIGYGCGGGGYARTTSTTQGFSCNDFAYGAGGQGTNNAGDGANQYGMGGGGGGAFGAAGGSGSVIIQYPIYDYCSNYFNETGSCGCRQTTFDVSDGLNYLPDQTASIIYMPCGATEFVSGTIDAYFPKTFCVVSNSYYSFAGPYYTNSGFITTGPECVSASLVPVACSPEAFPATCTSSIVTIYTPSGSGGNPTDFGYVAKNETTHSIYTTTEDRVKYICISTGSLFNGNQRYPQVLTGNFASLYNTASCNNVTFTSAAVGTRTYRYYNCNGNQVLSAFGGGGGTITVCVDRSAPFGFYGTTSSTSVTIGGDCLSGSFNTGSCGCP